ncbi:MAG: carboxypeptidase regulatory-like domain-containing protein [Vicingaceae bacterium]|nr:carboxypeptidase regulatory-like domain-containing protein [Vicingaceae bacterium]
MKPLSLIITVLLISTSVTFAQNDKKKSKITYKLKMAEANHALVGDRNYRAALNIYRELMTSFTNDAMINYRIGECYLAMNDAELAVEYFLNAKNLDEKIAHELYFKLGEAYHKNDQLDDALGAFNHFKANAKKKYLKHNDVNKMITQVNYAIKMKQHPVDVNIEILSKNINSRGGDYAPSITADGKTMIFTSRRSDTKGGGVDKAGDYKYFEDIYIAQWDSVNNEWGKAYPIEGNINTDGHDACLSISPSGEEIFIYRNDGNLYIGDIFVSKKRNSGKWSMPKPLEKPINTSYFESSAQLTADGNYLFFVSERTGKKNNPVGKGDIYVSQKKSNTVWLEPKNLGSTVNTPEDEISVFIHPDGRTLFFSSKGHLSMGGYDIFMTRLQDDSTWTTPQNLGYPINTVNDDLHFVLSTDGKTAYYSNQRKDGMGDRDIYRIDMSKYPVLTEGVAINLSILKGEIKNPEQEFVVAKIDFKDETGKVVASTTSTDEGHYFITLVGNKKYTLEITAEGYQTLTKTVELGIGKETILTQTANFVIER